MRSLVAVVVALALIPPGVRADDREWEEDYSGDWSGPATDYDVSVDLNVSGGATFETFHGPLSSYGEWVVAGNYGRVWRPRVAVGWRPYYYGRWEWTDEGWFWVSDEPWGWAAYHYGRWAHDPYYGWVWVPGYEWAPAWVSWRVSGDVVGWAPLAPGLSLYVSTYPFVDFWWTFVPTVRFVSIPVYTVAYAPSYTRQWYRRTAPAPARPAPAPGARPAPAPAPAWGGPAPRLVSERIGRPLAPARIVHAPAPGARARPGEIAVYRPGVRPAPARGRGPDAAPAPGRAGEPRYTPAPRGSGAAPPPAPGWSAPDRGRPERAAPVGPVPAERGRQERSGPSWSPPQSARPERAAPPSYRPEPRGQAAPSAPPARGGDRGGGREAEGGRDHRPAPRGR